MTGTLGKAGLVAVVARMPRGSDTRFGVKIIDVRGSEQWREILLTAAEWRAMMPVIEAGCRLSETPGRLPGEAIGQPIEKLIDAGEGDAA